MNVRKLATPIVKPALWGRVCNLISVIYASEMGSKQKNNSHSTGISWILGEKTAAAFFLLPLLKRHLRTFEAKTNGRKSLPRRKSRFATWYPITLDGESGMLISVYT